MSSGVIITVITVITVVVLLSLKGIFYKCEAIPPDQARRKEEGSGGSSPLIRNQEIFILMTNSF